MQTQIKKKTVVTDIGYTIRLDSKLMDAIRNKAKEKEMSINLYINTVLIKDVGDAYLE